MSPAKVLKALAILMAGSCLLYVWLLWLLSAEVLHSVTHRNSQGAAFWAGLVLLLICGMWRGGQEGWAMWKESQQRT
jgi:hypothetical protein